MKKWALTALYLTCYWAAAVPAEEDAQRLQQAENLRAEGLYLDALNHYRQLAQMPSSQLANSQKLLILSQAACHLELNEPEKALNLLKNSPLISSHDTTSLYLASLAYRDLQRHEEALTALNSISPEEEKELACVIALEKGVNSFYLNQFEQARLYLKNVSWNQANPIPFYLSQLYLIKLSLAEHNIPAAKLPIENLSDKLEDSHPLAYEKNYLEGVVFFHEGSTQQAIECFKKACPVYPCSWKKDVLAHLIKSYLKQSEQALEAEKALSFLAQAEETLTAMRAADETYYLLLSDFYLIKARLLKDKQAYEQAQQILNDKTHIKTEEGSHQAKLKQAAATPTYQERSKLYMQLIQEAQSNHLLQADAWYFKGMNELEEGLLMQKTPLFLPSASNLFELSAQSFANAYQFYSPSHTAQSAASLKYQALAYYHQASDLKKKQALELLQRLIKEPALKETFAEPTELYTLVGLISTNLEEPHATIASQTITLLDQALNQSRNEQLFKLKGILYTKMDRWQEADDHFAQFLQDHPDSEESEVLFWRAECASHLKNETARKQYLQQLYQQSPDSPYAPYAYFRYYTYRDYMRGQRKAIKHLQAMPRSFPGHPLLISAYYLIGLDYLKDRLSEEGELVQRKDKIAAIDFLHLAETTFDELVKQEKLPPKELAYFIQIRYQATLERALANLAIADASPPAKKHIYLEYTEDVFKELVQTLRSPSPLVKALLIRDQIYPRILQESEFWLAQTYCKKGKQEQANLLYDQLIHDSKQAGMEHGYLVSRACYEKGCLAQQSQDYTQALSYFLAAEQANATNFLSPDQKLDLWIQQSQCYKELKQFDEAMLLLSKVVNDEAISSLRVKAMYLRADLYALQGRPELALKQLEATSRKGGEWSKKAKEKLEQDYVY